MGRVKNCCYLGCRNDSRYSHRSYMKGVTFIPFPKPKTQLEKCKIWIKACNRPNFLTVNNITGDRYVCSEHFVDRAGPTPENPNPMSYDEFIRISNEDAIKLVDEQPNLSSNELKNYITLSHDSTGAEESNFLQKTEKECTDLMTIERKPDDDNINIEITCQPLIPLYDNSNKTVTASNMESIMEFSSIESEIQLISKGENSKPELQPELVKLASNARPDCEFIFEVVNNLEDIFINFNAYQSYYNTQNIPWSICKSQLETLSVYKSNTTYLGCIEVRILRNMTPEIWVHRNQLLKNHSVMSAVQFPQIITKIDDLLHCLLLIDSYNVCDGSITGDRRNFQENESVIFNFYNQRLHSNKCDLLIQRNSVRCRNCRILRSKEQKKEKPLSIGKNSSFKKFTTMDRKDLEISLRSKNKIIKALKRQAQRLKVKLSKFLKAKKTASTAQNLLKTKDLIDNLFGNIAEENSFDSKQNFLRFLLKQQAVLLKKNSQRPKVWPSAIIKWCLYLQNKSSAAYNTLGEVLLLPSPRTLAKYSSVYSSKSGFTSDAIKEMKSKIDLDKVDEHQKFISLIIVDEMKIKEDLVYKANTGEVVGFSNSTNSINNLKKIEEEKFQGTSDLQIPSHVMSLMVKGLTTNFKHSLAYFPCHDMKAEELYFIIQEAIEILENNGFRVLVVVCDNSSINQKLIKLSTDPNPNNGVAYKSKNPYAMPNEDRDIFYISDTPHLIKTARNCFANSGCNEKSRFLRKNGKNILWSHVKDMYKMDSVNVSHFKLCPKLTSKHIELGPCYAMRTKLATQVISDTVACAIEKLIGEESSETVKFIRLFNRFFDMLNTRNLDQGRRKRNPDLDPYTSVEDWRFKWLENDFLGYLKEWEEEANNSNVPEEEKQLLQLSRETLEGIHITVYSIIEATKFLLAKGAKFVYTDKFNQDPLEQHLL